MSAAGYREIGAKNNKNNSNKIDKEKKHKQQQCAISSTGQTTCACSKNRSAGKETSIMFKQLNDRRTTATLRILSMYIHTYVCIYLNPRFGDLLSNNGITKL